MKKKSYFYSYSKAIADSIFTKIRKSDDMEKKRLLSLIPKYTFKTIIEKNYVNNSMTIYDNFNNQFYAYSQEKNSNYQLLDKSKMIFGYNCKNAITELGGRQWEIWYTTDLPINDGPYKFSGLPGLVIEIKSLDNDYSFAVIGMVKTDNKIVLPKKVIRYNSFKEVLKEKYVKNPSSKSRLEDLAAGISGSAIVNGTAYSSEESYKLIDNELWNWMKINNNPLEKYDFLVL